MIKKLEYDEYRMQPLKDAIDKINEIIDTLNKELPEPNFPDAKFIKGACDNFGYIAIERDEYNGICPHCDEKLDWD